MTITPPPSTPTPLYNFTVVMLDGAEKVFKVAGIRATDAAVELFGFAELIAVFPLSQIRAVYQNEQQPNTN